MTSCWTCGNELPTTGTVKSFGFCVCSKRCIEDGRKIIVSLKLENESLKAEIKRLKEGEPDGQAFSREEVEAAFCDDREPLNIWKRGGAQQTLKTE